MSSCCSSPELMRKYKMILDSQFMKWYLNQPKPEGDGIFYKQNEFNRSTALINWQSKPVKKCHRVFPIRTCSCFPDNAPISSYPMRHRPVGAARPLNEKEIVRPIVSNRKELTKAFTFKLDKKKMRSD